MSFSVLLPACCLPDNFIANFEHINSNIQYFKSFMHNIEKWSNILCKSLGVHTIKFLKHIWSFFNIMQERVKLVFAFIIL